MWSRATSTDKQLECTALNPPLGIHIQRQSSHHRTFHTSTSSAVFSADHYSPSAHILTCPTPIKIHLQQVLPSFLPSQSCLCACDRAGTLLALHCVGSSSRFWPQLQIKQNTLSYSSTAKTIFWINVVYIADEILLRGEFPLAFMLELTN